MHVSSSAKYWDQVNEKFYAKYKGLDEKHKEWARQVASGSPIIGPLGRFWPIPMGEDRRGEIFIPWTILTNYPVQGTGADVMMLARISFVKRLRTKSWSDKCLVISSVHDSIVVDSPSQYLQEVTNLFHQVFDDLATNIRKIFGYNWEVPLACEAKYGNNMKQMTKIDRQDLTTA